MLINFLQKNKFFRNAVYKACDKRARYMVKYFESFLKKQDSILDVGSGTCNFIEILSKKGFNITPLDVQNLSFVDNIEPIIYKGNEMPFEDDKFDVALILTVLHHTPCPEKILKEAKRVSKKIIIIEEVYINRFHKYLTSFFDSLLNLEFIGHPHTNKKDEEWRYTFKNLGLKLVDAKFNYYPLFFKQAIYYLKK